MVLITYILVDEYLKFKKTKSFYSKSYDKFNQIFLIYPKKYIEKVEQKLFKLNYPYKITTKKYLVIKYFLSPIVFLMSLINYQNKLMATIISAISFFYLDYMIYSFKKSEKVLIINELKNLVNNIIICLSAYTTLIDALKVSIKALEYKRLKEELDKFVLSYEIYGYDIQKASNLLDGKFDSYELDMFINILKQSEKEGNILENLEKFISVLDLSYFKYLKRQSAKRLLNVTLGTVLLLVDIALIVMYPIFIQVTENLQTIFI